MKQIARSTLLLTWINFRVLWPIIRWALPQDHSATGSLLINNFQVMILVAMPFDRVRDRFCCQVLWPCYAYQTSDRARCMDNSLWSSSHWCSPASCDMTMHVYSFFQGSVYQGSIYKPPEWPERRLTQEHRTIFRRCWRPAHSRCLFLHLLGLQSPFDLVKYLLFGEGILTRNSYKKHPRHRSSFNDHDFILSWWCWRGLITRRLFIRGILYLIVARSKAIYIVNGIEVFILSIMDLSNQIMY